MKIKSSSKIGVNRNVFFSHRLSLFVIFYLFSIAVISEGKKNPLNGADPEDAIRTPEVEAYLITGEGSGAIGQQLKEWASSFSTLYFNMASRLVYYQSAVNYEVDIPYIVNRTLEFMSTERYDNKTIQKQYPQMKQFPFATQPIIFSYNVPGFLSYVVDRYNESIYLDPEALADIYMGIINNWNDTRIAKLNPHLTGRFPDLPIIPVGYFGRETSTYFLVDAFQKLSPRFHKAFPGEPFQDWPKNNTNVSSKLVTFFLGGGTLAYIQNTPGAIGYMPFYYFRTGGAGTNPYVLVKYNDEVLLPNKTTVLKMFDNATIDHKTGTIKGFEYNKHTTGWPFTAVSYIHLVEDSPVAKTKCSKDRLMLKFFRWIQVDEQAGISSSSNGIYMFQDKIRREVARRLEKLVCYGQSEELLAIEVIDDHDGAEFPALLALTMVFMGILLPPGVYLSFARTSHGRPNRVGIVYTMLMIIGACLIYTSVIFFYLVPDEQWVCQFRVWLPAIGYAIFLGAMFSRTYQFYRIFVASVKSRASSPISRGDLTRYAIMEICAHVGLVLLLQICLLVVWTIVDPLKSELSTIDDIERTSSWVCKSERVWLWIGLEIGFFMILLLCGLFVVYRTWDSKNRFPDSSWLLASIYNMIIILAAMIPLFIVLEIKDDNLYILAVVAIDFTVSTMLIAVYMTRLGGRFEKFMIKLRGKNASDTSSSQKSTFQSTQSISSKSESEV